MITMLPRIEYPCSLATPMNSQSLCHCIKLSTSGYRAAVLLTRNAHQLKKLVNQ